MADLISRQVGIEMLIKQKCTICPHCDNCDVNDDGTISQPDGRFINADELIKRLKEAGHEEAAAMALKMAGHERKKNLPSAQRWIPCSERLPEESGNYLVTAMWKGRPEIDMDYWQFDCMWDDWGDEVIAWMPLPEPWRGE